jgi:type IV pilus assembly protein PilC
MIDAGLPLVQGLNILAEQTENKTFKGILKQVTKDVESGTTLADALNRHPRVFDSLFVNLVAAGEVGGILDTIFQRLAAYIEKAEKLKSQVKGAMAYPIVVVCIAILVISVIMIFVIPVFEDMFAGFGKALPAPTQVVVAMSNFTKGNWYFIFGGMFAFVWIFRRYSRTSSGRRNIDIIALKLPIMGELIRKVAIARFTRTLSTMISSGVPILDALEITAKTAGNVIVEEVIMDARSSIAEGQTVAEPLSESTIFPGMVTQMISVGESTGALDAMLEKIADFYDDEVDAAVSAMTSMLEPLMILFLGGSVGGLVIAMYLPIFQMASAMGS